MTQPLYDPAQAVKAQRELTHRLDVPLYAPASGVCWSCQQNIYAPGGFSVADAAQEPITYCPFCNRSFLG